MGNLLNRVDVVSTHTWRCEEKSHVEERKRKRHWSEIFAIVK